MISWVDGLKRGVVVNLEKTVRSIQHAVGEAERISGRRIQHVYAGIAGDHIRGLTSRGVIAVSRKDTEIRAQEGDTAEDKSSAHVSSAFTSGYWFLVASTGTGIQY